MAKSPKKQGHSEGEHKTLTIFTIIVVALGILAGILAFYSWANESLVTVDRLARYDLGFEGAFVLTVRKCCAFAGVAGIFVALLAIVGLIGTRNNSKQLTCVYNVGLLTVGSVLLLLGVHALGRQATMEPVITRQVNDFCREDVFVRLTQHMSCSGTAGMRAAPVPCGPACAARVATLSRTGEGCQLLTGLCNKYLYTGFGTAPLPVVAVEGGFEPPFYSTATFETDDLCNRKCDHDMMCVGYQAAPSQCLIKSGNATRYSAPDWSVISTYVSSSSTDLMYLKGENAVLASFRSFGYGVGWIVLLFGVAMIIMWCLTIRILYNQNINKPGKPNAHQVGLMLCCPCCGGDEYQAPLQDAEAGTDYGPVE